MKKHFALREKCQSFISMITKPDIAAATDCYKVCGVIIRLIMVNMMNLKRTPVLFSGLATTLTFIAVTLTNKSLEFSGKANTIRKSGDSSPPIRTIGAAQLRNTFRRELVPLQSGTNLGSHFRWYRLALVRRGFTFMRKGHLLASFKRWSFAVSPFKSLPILVALHKRIGFALIPWFLTFQKATACIEDSTGMPNHTFRWFTHTIYRRDKIATTTGTRNRRHGKALNFYSLSIFPLSFINGNSHQPNVTILPVFCQGGA